MTGNPLSEPHWYAVMTGGGQETLAEKNLRRAGYWTFFPFDRVRRRRKRPGKNVYVVEWIERPYLPRYIFVALRFKDESFAGIEDCDGVSAIVRKRFDKTPMRIPGIVMDQIMDRAMVRFGEDDRQWFRALMRELLLDETVTTVLSINPKGKRSIETELLADAARDGAKRPRRVA